MGLAVMIATHARYVVKASRWQLTAVGALLGAATVGPSRLMDAGPFASPHLGIVLGTVGIALGGAFLLDDPAANTLAAVPRTLRRRALLRLPLLAAGATVALSGLALLAWERLAFAALAAQAGALALVGIAGAAVAGRLVGWRRPGLVGAAVVAALFVGDGLARLPGDASLLTGGSAAATDAAGLWAGLAAVGLAGLGWSTRDPATRPRRGRPTAVCGTLRARVSTAAHGSQRRRHRPLRRRHHPREDAMSRSMDRTASAHRRTGGERFGRLTAVAVGTVFLVAGVWAFVAPASFFEQAATFEPYNVHLIRDLGAFQIGLGAVLLLAAFSRDALLVALTGVGAGALFHLLGHVLDRDLGGEPAVDLPLFGLITLALVAAAVVRAAALRR
jgi:hypothetical protein